MKPCSSKLVKEEEAKSRRFAELSVESRESLHDSEDEGKVSEGDDDETEDEEELQGCAKNVTKAKINVEDGTNLFSSNQIPMSSQAGKILNIPRDPNNGLNANPVMNPASALNANFAASAVGGVDLQLLQRMMEARAATFGNSNHHGMMNLGAFNPAAFGKNAITANEGLATQSNAAMMNQLMQAQAQARAQALVAQHESGGVLPKSNNADASPSSPKSVDNGTSMDANEADKMPQDKTKTKTKECEKSDTGLASPSSLVGKTIEQPNIMKYPEPLLDDHDDASGNNSLGYQSPDDKHDDKDKDYVERLDTNPDAVSLDGSSSKNAVNAFNPQVGQQQYMQALQTIMQQPQSAGVLPPTNIQNKASSAGGMTGIAGAAELGTGDMSNRNENYRDFSRVANDGSDFQTNQPPGKESPFPVKLHRILSNPEYIDVISWLPHGRSWRVLKPKGFEEKVIPLYFRHAKYASFMRQVNGWGFKRMTQGPDHNSYYHELFLRGMQHLCYKMRRPTRARADGDSDFHPDFYRLSMIAPLPSQDMNLIGRMGNAGNLSGLSSLPTLQNPNLSSIGGLAGMNNISTMNGMMGMNNLTGMNGMDSSISNSLLQQQLQNQNSNASQQLSLAQGLQNGSGNLMGLPNTNPELNQLEALRQRREELVRQLQRMVNNGNGPSLSTSTMQPGAAVSNANALLNNNTSVMNGTASSLQGGLGNANNGVGSYLQSSNLGADPTGQLQQMMNFGMNGAGNNQHHALWSARSFVGTNNATNQVSLNNLPNSFGGGIAGLNPQQLLMQSANNMGGATNAGSALGGLGGINANMMSQNLGMMLQANQLMGQGNNSTPSTADAIPSLNFHNGGDNDSAAPR